MIFYSFMYLVKIHGWSNVNNLVSHLITFLLFDKLFTVWNTYIFPKYDSKATSWTLSSLVAKYFSHWKFSGPIGKKMLRLDGHFCLEFYFDSIYITWGSRWLTVDYCTNIIVDEWSAMMAFSLFLMLLLFILYGSACILQFCNNFFINSRAYLLVRNFSLKCLSWHQP